MLIFLLVLFFYNVHAMESHNGKQAIPFSSKEQWIFDINLINIDSVNVIESNISNYYDSPEALKKIGLRKQYFLEIAQESENAPIADNSLEDLQPDFANNLIQLSAYFLRQKIEFGRKDFLLRSISLLHTCTVERIVTHPNIMLKFIENRRFRKNGADNDDLRLINFSRLSAKDAPVLIDSFLCDKNAIESFLGLILFRTYEMHIK